MERRLATLTVMESRSCCSLDLRDNLRSDGSREVVEEGGGDSRGTIRIVVPLMASVWRSSPKSSGLFPRIEVFPMVRIRSPAREGSILFPWGVVLVDEVNMFILERVGD